MGTEIHAIMGHNLCETEIAELPNGLNALFQRSDRPVLCRRFPFGGEVVKHGGKFSWDPDYYPKNLREPIAAGVPEESPWRMADYTMTGVTVFSGPFGLDFWFGSQSACLGSSVHWEYLAFDKIFQSDFRQIVHLLSDFLESPFAIYVPDDVEPWCNADEGVRTGKSLDQIRSWLFETGEPVKCFENLLDAKDGSAAGYIIDKFKAFA